MHHKSYQEHLREARYCGLQWRILHCVLSEEERTARNLPKFRVLPVFCNSKACARCSKRRFQEIHARFKYQAVDQTWRMFTLTSRKTKANSQEELENLENNFRELRKYLKRKYPNFQYFAVKELSPQGMWHIHGIWSIHIDVKILSTKWEEISGAYRVWLSKVRNPASAINYTFKYCYKSITNPKERELLYNSDKRKFSYSKGLFTKRENSNPYSCEIGIQYSVDELKEELFNIVLHSQYSINDFSGSLYPYFEDLIYNIFYEVFNKGEPQIFTPEMF